MVNSSAPPAQRPPAQRPRYPAPPPPAPPSQQSGSGIPLGLAIVLFALAAGIGLYLVLGLAGLSVWQARTIAPVDATASGPPADAPPPDAPATGLSALLPVFFSQGIALYVIWVIVFGLFNVALNACDRRDQRTLSRVAASFFAVLAAALWLAGAIHFSLTDDIRIRTYASYLVIGVTLTAFIWFMLLALKQAGLGRAFGSLFGLIGIVQLVLLIFRLGLGLNLHFGANLFFFLVIGASAAALFYTATIIEALN